MAMVIVGLEIGLVWGQGNGRIRVRTKVMVWLELHIVRMYDTLQRPSCC